MLACSESSWYAASSKAARHQQEEAQRVWHLKERRGSIFDSRIYSIERPHPTHLHTHSPHSSSSRRDVLRVGGASESAISASSSSIRWLSATFDARLAAPAFARLDDEDLLARDAGAAPATHSGIIRPPPCGGGGGGIAATAAAAAAAFPASPPGEPITAISCARPAAFARSLSRPSVTLSRL